MATTITIQCPHCDRQLKAPADVLGKKLRCKGCDKVFTAAREDEDEAPARPAARKAPAKAGPSKPASKPAPAKKGAPQKPPPAKSPFADEEEDDNPNPYGVTEEYLGPRCPSCANAMESEDAIICLACGYNTRTRESARMRKVRHTTGFDIFLWLLPGIACVIGIIALATIDILYCTQISKVDPEAWYSFLNSLGFKIWLVVPSLFIMFGLGRFAVKRLIFNPMPPEIEEKI